MSKDAKNVPALRFKGFSDAWEKRKLGSIGKIKSGSGFPSIEQGGKQGIPFYKVSDMNTSGNKNSMVISQNYVTSAQLKKRKWTPITNTPAIIFAKVGAAIFLDRKRVVEHPFLIDNNMMAYIVGDAWNLRFCQAFFQSIPLLKFAQTGALPSLNAHDIGRIPVHLPTRYEQKEIGDLIYKVTRLIAATQDKLDCLERVKKALLQHLFDQSMRFKGYSDPWEKRKLGDVVERVTRKNKNIESTLPLTISAQNGLVDQRTFFSKTIAGKDTKNYLLLKSGEFAYNRSYSVGNPWGAVRRLDRYPSGILSSLYIAFKPLEIDSQFLVAYFNGSSWYRAIRKVAAEGARNHGLLNISASDFFDQEMMIPAEQSEQEIIGFTLDKVDDLIAATQSKLSSLESLKKALLQGLFI